MLLLDCYNSVGWGSTGSEGALGLTLPPWMRVGIGARTAVVGFSVFMSGQKFAFYPRCSCLNRRVCSVIQRLIVTSKVNFTFL